MTTYTISEDQNTLTSSDGAVFEAKAQGSCEGCAFVHKYQMCNPAICASSLRSDCTSVIFVEKPKLNKEIEKENKMKEMQTNGMSAVETNKVSAMQETKQFAVTDKSKEYWEIICEAYSNMKAEVFFEGDWIIAISSNPHNAKDWLNFDWRIKPKNRTVTFEIPEDLKFSASISPNWNGNHELSLYLQGEKETLQKIVEAFQKS